MSDWLVIPLGIWLIGLSSASWLIHYPHQVRHIQGLVNQPFLGYSRHPEKSFLVSTMSKLGKSAIAPSISVQTTQSFCKRINSAIHCNLPASFSGGFTQFPALYYSDLLTVLVDKKKVAYKPTVYDDRVILIGIDLSPGRHVLDVEFTGISWANRISIVAWILGLVGFIIVIFRKTRRCFSFPCRIGP